MKYALSSALLAMLLSASTVSAQTDSAQNAQLMASDPAIPRPVSAVRAEDSPNDHGHSITLTWDLSPDDGNGANNVRLYEIERWTPYYLDTLHADQGRIDSLTGVNTVFRRYLPVAQDLLKKYTKQGLQDSVSKYTDTVAAMRRMMPSLPSEIKRLERSIKNDWERAPTAHAQYPNHGEWRRVGESFAGVRTFVNSGQKDLEAADHLPNGCDYYYRVITVTANPDVRSLSEIVGPVQAYGQWYNNDRTPSLFATSIFLALVILFVSVARKGKDLYVRPLGGIEAVDEAIGRATEMGKPILYVLGLGTAADIATIASFTVLGRVARRVAEYQTELIVPTYDPIVMSVAQEAVKTGYADAGRPDAYKDDTVFFVTQNQFAYVSAVNGIMLRQLPATNIYMGKFFAESLILAETGALAGSIQIAGTDEIAQIPFFVVACDYTLIGEELYAASAYLGREPILLGSLKAQDLAKAAVIIFAIAGIVSVNLGWPEFKEYFRVIR